jgi:hypothetical protein
MSFKASVDDLVELLVDVPSEFSDRVIPSGTRGTVVARHEQPKEGYPIDLAFRDDSSIGGFRYEDVVLTPEQFAVPDDIG